MNFTIEVKNQEEYDNEILKVLKFDQSSSTAQISLDYIPFCKHNCHKTTTHVGKCTKIVLCTKTHMRCICCQATCEKCGLKMCDFCSIKCDSCDDLVCEKCVNQCPCKATKTNCVDCNPKCDICDEMLCNECSTYDCESCSDVLCSGCTLQCDACEKNFCKSCSIEKCFICYERFCPECECDCNKNYRGFKPDVKNIVS